MSYLPSAVNYDHEAEATLTEGLVEHRLKYGEKGALLVKHVFDPANLDNRQIINDMYKVPGLHLSDQTGLATLYENRPYELRDRSEHNKSRQIQVAV